MWLTTPLFAVGVSGIIEGDSGRWGRNLGGRYISNRDMTGTSCNNGRGAALIIAATTVSATYICGISCS